MGNNILLSSEHAKQFFKSTVRSFSVSFRELATDDCRLDATFYADETIAAWRTVQRSGFDIKPLDHFYSNKTTFLASALQTYLHKRS